MKNYTRIDNTVQSPDGFSYTNQDGFEESVDIRSKQSSACAQINLRTCEPAVVYHSDIPNLIKALQAAYDATK